MILKKCKSITAVTTSARRISLLRKIKPDIRFTPPVYKEKNRRWFILPVLLCMYHAFRKGGMILCGKNEALIAFDTIVYRYGNIFCKPKSGEEAMKTIRALSNKRHKVVTSIFLKYAQRKRIYYRTSTVKFKRLSEDEIRQYIAEDEWKDKAGGYGIQGHGRDLVEWYRGDLYNIIGLPLDLVIDLLKKD